MPALAAYNSNMLTYGTQNCNRLKAASGNDQWGQPNGLNDTYYDAEWIFFQIADYTGNTATWIPCAAAAHKVYSQNYVAASGGVVPGYWLFPHGIAQNHTRINPQVGTTSLATYNSMKANAPFVNSSSYNDTYQGGCGAWYAVRETSYALMVHQIAPQFSQAVNTNRTNQLKTFLFTALDQTWSGAASCVTDGQPAYKKPFMTALAAQALIMKWDAGDTDPMIVTKLKAAADNMWSTMWLGTSFKYTNNASQGQEATPDLNLLIAPMFYWIYKQTHDTTYLTRGDAIWTNGVTIALNLQNGKQFNQNYRWSMMGIIWRNG